MNAIQGILEKTEATSVTTAQSPASSPASAPTPAAAPAPGNASAAPKSAYPPVASLPTQATQAEGLRFDFNLGARVQIPAGNWRVRLRDLDTGNILYETATANSQINSSKRYFIRFGVEVWNGETQVLNHQYNAANQDVLIQFPIGTLGDLMAWFPYAVKFQEKHRCRLTCTLSALIIPLFKDAYPHITFLPHEDVDPEQFYASYRIGLFFDDADCIWQPCDFRLVGLHRTAGYILGVDPAEQRPALALPDDTRPIAEPYVCIAVQSSSRAKYWNNLNGWRETVAFLKQNGLRVICIDQKPVHGQGFVWTEIPHGAEDQTRRPATDRARPLAAPRPRPLSASQAASPGSPGPPDVRW